MKIEITTLRYTTDHESNLTVHGSEAAAKQEKFAIALSGWDNVWCADGEDCDVADCEGVPSDPAMLDPDEAIDTYFQHRESSSEFAVIEPHEVDIPLSVLFGDWVQRVQDALTRWHIDPRVSANTFVTLLEELLARDQDSVTTT